MSRGRLLLVPNALDLGSAPVSLDAVLPRGVIEAAARIEHWVCENAKPARAFLKRVAEVAPLAAPLQALDIKELPRARKGSGDGIDATAWRALLAPALHGRDLGLVSDAGLPAVADPGAGLVAAAHASGLAVLPLAGPSALLLALAASGLDGQSFAFAGYLPQQGAEQARRIQELETQSRRQRQTQIVIETPYRNAALLRALLLALQPDTRLSVSCGLTLEQGWSRMRRVADWRRDPVEMPADVPAVFCWLAA